MIKKIISYHDFDGNERQDEFYFSLNQVQFARINARFPDGLEAYVKKIIKDQNANELFRVIDILVSEAYGERRGNAFVKVTPDGQKLSDFFTNTEAYDNLLTELITKEDNLVAFLTGCLNQDAQVRMNAEMAKIRAKMKEEQEKGETAAEDNVVNLPEGSDTTI